MSRSLMLSVAVLSLVAAAALVGPGGPSGLAFAQDEQPQPAAAPAKAAVDHNSAAGRMQHTFDLSTHSPASRRIEQALENPQGVDIEFVDQPLKEAMEYMAEAQVITIILDQKALQDEGIQTDEPLNQILSGITLRSALDIMLEPLGLTYVVDDEVLKITTRIVADEQLETRVYDVRPLAQAGIGSEDLAKTITRTIRTGTWAGTAFPTARIGREGEDTTVAIGGGEFASPAGDLAAGLARSASSRADAAAGCFACSLHGWVRADGAAPVPPETGLVALDGALVVTHSQDVHRRITALLEQLARLTERPGGDGR